MDVTIVLTWKPDDSFWGFSDLVEDLGPDATDEEIRDAIIELVMEDATTMFDKDGTGAEWSVTWQPQAD